MATSTHTQCSYYNILILVFLLVARAGCDWVEISQNQYRKESPRQGNVKINFEDTTNAVYQNNSSLEKHWKKGVIDKVPSLANIKRVHMPSVKTSSIQTEKNILTRPTNIHDFDPDGSYESVISKPNILSKYHEEGTPIDPSEIIEVPYHTNYESTFERNSEGITFHKSQLANTNKVTRIESINNAYISNVTTGNSNRDIGSVKLTYLTYLQNKDISTSERTPQIKYIDESNADLNYERGTGAPKVQLNPKPSTAQSLPMNIPTIEKQESFINRKKIDEIRDQYVDDVEFEYNTTEGINNSDRISNNPKGKTVKAMWKLIKTITDSIYKSTRKSFKNKIHYLQELKSNILSSIEYQVERTWPDDNTRSSRSARDAEGRGHVEFPSSESALMSISFLTFAVFLIKLVLQVIHTYKNKTMMVTPAVVTAVGRAAAAMKSNQK